MKALFENSPGKANLHPVIFSRTSNILLIIAILPWVCISNISSPVYDEGDLKKIINPRSIIESLSSKKLTKFAVLLEKFFFFVNFFATFKAFEPESLITPMAERPYGVDNAKIVSFFFHIFN